MWNTRSVFHWFPSTSTRIVELLNDVSQGTTLVVPKILNYWFSEPLLRATYPSGAQALKPF